jgi:uncharacterized protein (DUF849 family)
VHLHARNPKDGSPTQDPELFRQFGAKIRAASDVVLNFTTGGAPTMSIEERLQPALKLKPERLGLGKAGFSWRPHGETRTRPRIHCFSEVFSELERPRCNSVV